MYKKSNFHKIPTIIKYLYNLMILSRNPFVAGGFFIARGIIKDFMLEQKYSFIQ